MKAKLSLLLFFITVNVFSFDWDTSNVVVAVLPRCLKAGSGSADFNSGTFPVYGSSSELCTLFNMTSGYGYVDGEIIFDGSNDYVSLGDLAELNKVETFTMEIWIKQTTTPAAEYFFRCTDGDTMHLFILALADSSMRITNQDSNVTERGTLSDYTPYMSSDVYGMITWVYDGSQAAENDRSKIYFDGDSVELSFGSVPDSTGDLAGFKKTISAATSPLEGAIESFVLYTNAFTSAEVATNYALGSNYGNIRAIDVGGGEVVLKDSLLSLDTNSIGQWDVSNVALALLPQCLKNGSNPSSFNSGEFPKFGSTVSLCTLTNMTSGFGYDSTEGSIKFDGVNDFVSLGNLTEVDSVTEFTMEWWVKFEVVPFGGYLFHCIVGNYALYNATSPTDLFTFAIDDKPGTFRIKVQDYSDDWSGDTYAMLTWVFDGSLATDSARGRIFVNNVQMTNIDYGNGVVNVTGDMDGTVKTLSDVTTTFNGDIMSYVLYTTALTDAQRAHNYNLGPTYGGIRGWDNGDGTIRLKGPKVNFIPSIKRRPFNNRYGPFEWSSWYRYHQKHRNIKSP